MKKIGEKIREYMKTAGMTTRALADKMGCNEKTLGNKLAGRRDFDTAEIVRFLEEFPDVSSDWLMRDSGPMISQINNNVSDKSQQQSVGEGYYNQLVADLAAMKQRVSDLENKVG